jgi:RNA polymerase sigma factor (sigma-70 family)
MLVGAHLRGDTDAFSIIVDDHYEVLVARARRMLGSGGQVEDAVQETFERALRNVSKFGLTGEYRLGAWLNRILSNVCSDQRASNIRDLRLARIPSGEARYQGDVADQVSDPATMASVEDAFHGLPASLHAAFVRHELDGMPYSDLAVAENISIENARARVHRARASLRRRLTGIESAAGSLISLPLIRRVFRAGKASNLASVGPRSWRHLFSLGDPTSAPASFGGSAGGVSSFIERVASQLTISQIGQTAMAIVSNVPRGTLVFGLAATAATVSASAVALAPSDVSANAGASTTIHVVQAADVLPASPQSPTLASPASPAQQAAVPTSAGSAYSWVNAGLGGSSSSSGNTPAAAAVAGSACASADGITPPGSGFSVANPLGLDDAVSVANTPGQPLLTSGQYLAFDSRAQLSAFGSSSPSGTEAAVISPSPSTSVSVDTAMCLSAADPWLTAQITGVGLTAVELEGTLVEVVGSPEASAYIFRGVVSGQSGDPGSSPATGSQFVAQVTVLDSQSTAQPEPIVQLTVVFLAATSDSATTSNSDSATTSNSDSATTSTSTSTSTSDSGPSSLGLTDASNTDFSYTQDALNTGATFGSPSLDSESGPFSVTLSWLNPGSSYAGTGSTTVISSLPTG